MFQGLCPQKESQNIKTSRNKFSAYYDLMAKQSCLPTLLTIYIWFPFCFNFIPTNLATSS